MEVTRFSTPRRTPWVVAILTSQFISNYYILEVECRVMGERYAYGCGAELDGFKRVFDLEEAALGGEGAEAAELVGYPSKR